MNILNFFGVFLILVALLGLSAFWGCGDREDSADAGVGLDTILSDEFEWPSGTTGEPWELTDADIAELLATNPPPDRSGTEAPDLEKKYYLAQLLKQFGDIPEVRYLIAFQRKPGRNVTREQAIAYFEANYRLFPNETNRKVLLDILSRPQFSGHRGGLEWMNEDPEGYMEFVKGTLLRRYGDIPEVHTYVRLELNRLLGKKLTDAEREARNAASLHLKNLDEQGEAKLDEAPEN